MGSKQLRLDHGDVQEWLKRGSYETGRQTAPHHVESPDGLPLIPLRSYRRFVRRQGGGGGNVVDSC